MVDAMYNLLLCIFFTLIGSVIKDLYNKSVNKDYKVNIINIIISSVTAAFISLLFKNIITTNMGETAFIVIAFLTGIVGIDLFTKVATLDKLLESYNKYKEYMQNNKKDL